MKPKERVLSAIEHRSTDRIPLDWWSTPETISNMSQFLSTTPDGVLESLDIDIRYIGFDINSPDFLKQQDGSFQKKDGNGLFEDVWGVKREKVTAGKGEYFELRFSPLACVDSQEEIEKYTFPDISNFDIEKDKIGLSRNYATVFTGDRMCMRTSFFKLSMYLRGFENFLLDLIANKVLAETIINRLFEFHYELTKQIFEKYSKSIDIFLMGDDFGTQTGPLIGLETFRYFFKNPLKKMIELCHKYGIKAMLHSCGSVKIFIPDLIDIGLDILNPVQHNASGMDLKELKTEFGRDICFHGAVDVQNVLPFGNKKEIEDEVKKCIQILGENGGYICAPSHNLQADIPVENIVFMYEVARNFR
ncbi:MAG: hypothetical protein NC913_02480 [Candidatus Omnitrophica bacterium]|nr:hypothetical protein [Candidatus Omnitrophota bacterium]